ncbi:MAG: class I SAM-dependent methyltransferase [Phycisphaerae bacterium]|nr:class I SAM-dependent methyltransferase [Phycisphaerae bacterium]
MADSVISEEKKQILISRIISQRPKLHGRDGQTNWQVNADVLNWLAANVRPSMTTLETGCGSSTIAFALCGASHTVITPASGEFERVVQWCKSHEIETDLLEYIDGCSEIVLPTLKADPLDVVLIDGRHAFPTPFIDWYYTASRLKVGGRVIVDDTFIRSCKILNEFLHAEKGRWVREVQFPCSSIYKKVSEEIHPPNWTHQPWGNEKIYNFKSKMKLLKNKTKNKVLRSIGLRE